MNQESKSQVNIKQMVIKAIQKVAPEIEESMINPNANLREECDLDSMDFLNVLTALKKASEI